MKEIDALIRKAKRYLKSARILLEDGDYESSVSRTYYAMFYCAQAMLLAKNLSFSRHTERDCAFDRTAAVHDTPTIIRLSVFIR